MLLQQVTNEDAPSPRKLNSSVPRDLETVCLKCLEKQPSKRYSTTREFSNELQLFLRGEPIHARPITSAERAWRWCKRKPMVSALTCSLAVAVLGGLAGVTLQWRRAEHNATVARSEAERADLNAQEITLSLYRSLLREAQATRMARESGYRRKVWQRLTEAMALGSPEMNLLELRQEAVACMGDFVGVDPMTLKGFSSEILALAAASRGDRFAVAMADKTISIRDLSSGEEMARLPAGPGVPHFVSFAVAHGKPNDVKIVVAYAGSGDDTLWVWKQDDNGRWVGHKAIQVANIDSCAITPRLK